MFEIEITSLAQLDIEEAYYYYEGQRVGLGEDLKLCFEEALAVIKRNPYFNIRLDNIRAYNIRRFPYQIFYEIHENRIIVLSFFFGKRNPNIWQERKQ
jgi:plasmid stabilization system protein ParE